MIELAPFMILTGLLATDRGLRPEREESRDGTRRCGGDPEEYSGEVRSRR